MVRRGDRQLLADVNWTIHEGECWVILGPNGAGKTTLLQVASARMFPTAGQVIILGEEMGAVDVADLKRRIGWASSILASDIPPQESVSNVVLTGAYAFTGRWRESYDSVDDARVANLLGRWGLTSLAGRTFGTLSEGERKRVLIARALMADPEVLVLDEPSAGLDLGGREDLLSRLTTLARDPDGPVLILVTHHVEEIPAGFTHALLLSAGRVIAAGPIDDVMDDASISRTYGLAIQLEKLGDRRAALLAPAAMTVDSA